jgi:7,8-dihydroneopterin 2',3'-cyclic phosphate phosphodiesterase
MKRLLKMADRIKDRELRKKVIDVLKNPKLSNRKFKYRAADPEKLPSSINYHHVFEGGNVEHTYAVTLLCIRTAETLKEVYGAKIDMDALIASALIHDFGKLWTVEKKKGSWEATDLTLDHTILGSAELYAREFPEKVIHIVASHFGMQGPTPPSTIEAVILHYMDDFDASTDMSEQEKQEKLVKLLTGKR